MISEFVTCPCSATNCSAALGILGGNGDSSLKAEGVMDYLNKSHFAHFDEKMAVLEEELNALLVATDDERKKIVGKFFSLLRNEVAGHFEYEESVVFPYVASLLACGAEETSGISGGCSMETIEGNHESIMEKLSDLKAIVMNHLPTSCDRKLRNRAILDIFSLEEDLNHHIRLENDILLPVMKNLENHGR